MLDGERMWLPFNNFCRGCRSAEEEYTVSLSGNTRLLRGVICCCCVVVVVSYLALRPSSA